MENQNYIVYIKINEMGYVTNINSSAFLKDTSSWIAIDEGLGDKYHHAQGNYFEYPLSIDGDIHNYIYENGVCRLATEEEKAIEKANLPAPEPTPLQKVQEENTTLKERVELLENCLIEVGQVIYA